MGSGTTPPRWRGRLHLRGAFRWQQLDPSPDAESAPEAQYRSELADIGDCIGFRRRLGGRNYARPRLRNSRSHAHRTLGWEQMDGGSQPAPGDNVNNDFWGIVAFDPS